MIIDYYNTFSNFFYIDLINLQYFRCMYVHYHVQGFCTLFVYKFFQYLINWQLIYT